MITDDTDTDPDAARQGPTTPARPWRSWLLAGGVILVLTVAMFRPVIGHCDTRILGAPGDATAGGVWTAWNYAEIPGAPWRSSTSVTGAPSGERWWQPQFLTAMAVFVPLWAGGNLISPVCTWNIAVAAGFLATGLAVFGLIRWLVRRTDVAILGMIAYTFSPYRQIKAEGHLAYVYAFGFPLLLGASLLLWQRATPKRALLAGVALAALGYTDGYYLLIGGVSFAAFHVVALAYRLVVERQPVRTQVPAVLGVVGAGVTAVLLLAPVAITSLLSSNKLTAALTRSPQDIVRYAARPWEYVVPGRSHPFFKDIFGPWADRHLHGSNYGEQSLYLGWVVIIGVALCVFALVASKRWRQLEIRPGLSVGFVVTVVLGVFVTTLLFSGPATAYIGDQPIPLPSRAVYKVVKLWRVFSRFFVVVHLAAVVLASFAAARLLARRSLRTRAIAVTALGAAIMFELAVAWSPGYWTYEAVPTVYRAAGRQPGDILAEYPLEPTSVAPDNAFLTWQPVHEKRLFNVRNDGTDQAALRRGLYGLGDPQTLPALRQLGVDLVVVRRDLYRGVPDEPVPEGLELVDSFTYREDRREVPALRAGRWPWLARYFDADLYRVVDGPVGELAVAVGAGVRDPEPRDWKSFHWLGTEADIEVVRLSGKASSARVTFRLEPAFGEARTVEIRQGDRLIDRIRVGRGGADAAITVDVGEPVTIRTTPGERAISEADDRLIAVGISDLGVTAVP